jgi:hypothetical protein
MIKQKWRNDYFILHHAESIALVPVVLQSPSGLNRPRPRAQNLWLAKIENL